ncbi:dynein regulatory complex protein 9 [Plectropomus leopardus]|uniref:dynein regulatory complex protein 9 n=1 Tax=Plectropomus leopardus TaxID=160734 RepID=UPI001C4CDE53|nr:dynein regulatory complex protein 9 [Plectropomus leopardus]
MSLSRIQSLRLAAVLEDCSDQLDLLEHTLTVKIGRQRGTAAAQEKSRLTNLRKDCQYVSQQVSKLHLELQEKQSLSSLLQVVKIEEQKKVAENMRREAKRELEQRKQTLRRQEEELRQKTETLMEMKRLARQLNHQLREQSETPASRVEQNIELQLQQAQRETSRVEMLLEEEQLLLERQLKEEKRVHEESHKFLQKRLQELQQQLKHWQQLTKQMLQEKEQKLNSVSCKQTLNLDRLMEMRRKFREMEQVVMEDREEQEKLRQQQAEARAATKLQACWRGCMVRRGLGTFKKAEEVKKGKKKKKKEGKKKK